MCSFLRRVARSGLAGSHGNAEFSRVRNSQRGVRLSLILQPYFITLYSGTGTSMGTGVSGNSSPVLNRKGGILDGQAIPLPLEFLFPPVK